MGVQFAGNILVQSDGGPLPIISGGTGQTSATEAITALLPAQTGQTGKALVTNGTIAAWQNISGVPGGSDTFIQYNDAGTFGGSSFLTVNKSTGAITSTSTLTNQGLTISKAVSVRDIKYQTSGSDRWILRTNSTAESGSDVGSDFQLIRIADNGSTQNIAYTVSRSTGVVDFATAPTIAGVPLTSDAAALTGTTLATNVTNSSLTTLGTITTGTWSATAIAANKGGTGQTSYTVGDILYANTGSTLSKLVAGTSGFVLTSNGAGTAPSWQTAGGSPTLTSTQVGFGSGSNLLTSSSDFTFSGQTLSIGVFTNTNSARLNVTGLISSGVDNGNGGPLAIRPATANSINPGYDLTLTGGVSTRAGGAVNITGGAENTNGYGGGNVNITGGGGISGTGFAGSVVISGGVGTSAQGGVIFKTANTTRFSLNGDGSWQVGGTGGSSGQVLTSTGNTTAPTWQTASAGTPSTLANTTTLGDGTANGILRGAQATSVARLFQISGSTSTGTGIAGGAIQMISGTGTDGAGGALTLQAGAGVGSGARLGGSVSVTAGAGSSTGATGSSGGTLSIASGGATASGSNGGALTITGGGSSLGTGGPVTISAGTGNAGATLTLNGGSTNGAGPNAAGNIIIHGGDAPGATATGAGNVTISGGTGGTIAGGYVAFSTAPTGTQTERFRILANGAWSVGASGTNTGSSGQALISSGSTTPPAWGTPISATNIAGLATNNILYQSASGTTTGTNAFQWIAGSNTLQLGNAATFISGGSTNLLFTIQGLDAAGAVAAPVLIRGGNGTGSGGAGGALTLQAGNTAIGGGKDITVQGGTGSSAGGAIIFQTAATTSLTEAMRITPARTVGIGTGSTVQASGLEILAASNSVVVRQTSTTGYAGVRIYNDQNSATRALEIDYSGSAYASGLTGGPTGEQGAIATTGAFPLVFGTSNSARMVIDATGNVIVGNPSATPAGTVYLRGAAGSRPGVIYENAGVNYWNVALKGDAGQNYYQISNGAETVGVYMTPSASGWNNLSDERFKENWTELTDAATKIKTLRAGTFTWIADPSLPQDVGLIAQDVQLVLPEAVDDTDPDRLGVRYSATIPLLVKALQEALARIEVLEAQVAAL